MGQWSSHALSQEGPISLWSWDFFPHHCVGFLSLVFLGYPCPNYWRLSLINLSVSSPNVVMQHHATHRNSLEPRRRGFSSFPSVYSDYGTAAFWCLLGPVWSAWLVHWVYHCPTYPKPQVVLGQLVRTCFMLFHCSSRFFLFMLLRLLP